MTSAVTEGTGLVRVSVVRAGRRADLAVPGAVNVADLLPELVASVGALDPYTVPGGYRLVRPDGTSLRPDDSLTAQGVEDGFVLTVEVGADDEPPKVYDDVIEAVADSIEGQARPWSPEASRRTALVAASLALALAALALGMLRSQGLPVALAGAVVALLLVTASAVLARGQEATEVAVVVGALSAVFGGVAGLAVMPDEAVLGFPLALAGGGVLLFGALATAAVVERRAALLPAVVLGSVMIGTGGVVVSGDASPAKVAACAMALVVVAGALVPWLSMSTTRIRVPQPRSDADLLADPDPLDSAEVQRQVRVGREVLVALTASVGVVLVLTAPLVVSLGLTGTVLVVVAATAVLLRTRQYRDAVEVVVGVGAAVAAMVVAVASAALLQPGWRTVLAGVLLVVGTALLAAGAVPRTPSVRFGRLGDLAEGVALVALLPLLVAALGVFG